MDAKQSLLLDVISILPDTLVCYIQAPSLDDEVILGLTVPSQFDYYRQITLDPKTKETFITRIRDYQSETSFHSIEIKHDDVLLFEGYDGVEFGLISKNIVLPAWFIDKCINGDMCTVAGEW